MFQAVDDGWRVHPDNSAFWFKGQEVLTAAQLYERYRFPVEPWEVHRKDARFYRNSETGEILTEAQLRRRLATGGAKK